MEKKYLDRLKYNFRLPTQVLKLMSLKQKNIGPEWYIYKTMWESRKNMTTKTLWKRITEDDESIKSVRSMNHMRNNLLVNVLRKGKAIRASSEEFPQFKKSGWKIIPNRAFKSYYPSQLVTLNPIPILLRKDLVMYLLRMKKAYELYPKEHHDYIDKVSVEYKKMSDDWMQIIEMMEDVDHPVRGERLRGKTRLETFLDGLTPEEKERLLKQEEEELDKIDDESLKTQGKEYKEIKTIDDIKKDSELMNSPQMKYYLGLIDPNAKNISLPVDEEEKEVEEFYRKWKEDLSKK